MANEQQDDQVAILLKTIAHPSRLRILLTLTEQPSLNVSTLQQRLQIELTLLSKHLLKLKENKILTSRRSQNSIYYALTDPSLVVAIRKLIDSY